MIDMGAVTNPHPIWQGIPQVMKPVDPLAYGEARREWQSRRTLRVKDSLAQKSLVGK
jgi:hypothetical protein